MECGFQFDFLSLAIKHQQKNKTNYSHDKKKNIQQAALNYDVAFRFYWFDEYKKTKQGQ